MTSSRRAFFGGVTRVLSTAVLASTAWPLPAGALPPAFGPLSSEALSSLEGQGGGRFGVAVIDGAGAELASYRADERFPLCSTFKVLAVAAVLARVDRGEERLDRPIAFGAGDLLEYAPVVRARAEQGTLRVSELCDAASP
ncbi:MAG TPA: serine hydrolase [Polyangiaceae bacterium]|nr:serine hydrolase [Polyangiaceae bacterium]